MSVLRPQVFGTFRCLNGDGLKVWNGLVNWIRLMYHIGEFTYRVIYCILFGVLYIFGIFKVKTI